MGMSAYTYKMFAHARIISGSTLLMGTFTIYQGFTRDTVIVSHLMSISIVSIKNDGL